MSDLGDIKLTIEANLSDTLDQLKALRDALQDSVNPPDTAQIADAFRTVADMAIESAKQASSAFGDVQLSAPEIGGIVQQFNEINETAEASARAMAQSFADAPIAPPDTTPITEALGQTLGRAEAVSAAITDALNTINTDGVVAALQRLNESSVMSADDLDNLWARMKQLIDTGEVATQTEALQRALQELGQAAQDDVDKLDALAAAERAAGDAANEGGDGQKKFSEGAQSIIDKQAELDENLRQAIATLGEMHDAYGQGQVSADALAQAENRVDEALRAANPNLESVKANVKEVAQETETAADKFAKFAEAMAGVAAAFAFTEGLRELGMAALEAADHVDDATQAIGKLGGGAEVAQATVGQLRQIASDEALSFPQLLIASQRMTAFLGDATKVPDVMRAAGDASKVMGIGVETAAKAIERFAAGGDLSAKSLKQLGLTMGDMAAVLGTTEANAKKAFAALDQSGKVDAVTAALGKFSGAAKQMEDDALGSLVRLGQSWSQVLEEIGKALDPVIKALADFAKSNIVEPIRDMAAAFNQLPAPVKDFAVAIGIAAAAVVPVAAGIAGVVAAIGPLGAAFAAVSESVAGVAGVIGGALAVSLSEVLIPIAAVGAAIAVLEFTGLGDDIMAFLQGPLADLKEGFSLAAETIKTDFSEAGTSLKEFFEALGPLIRDTVELSWKPLVDVVREAADAFGIATPEVIKFSDVIHAALELTGPVAALDFLNKNLQALKIAIDDVRPVIQLLSGDIGLLKQASNDAASAMRLQQDLANQNARLMADAAMGFNKAAEATSAYGAGLKTLQEQQQKLNDAVTQAKGVMEAARDAYDGTQKSQEVLNRATSDYEKAVKAATGATDSHKQSVDKVSASFITYTAALRDFVDVSTRVVDSTKAAADIQDALAAKVASTATSLDNAKKELDYWVASLNSAEKGSTDYINAQQEVDKWLVAVEKDQKAYNAALDAFDTAADTAGTALRSINEAISQAGGAVLTAADNLHELGIESSNLAPPMDAVNKALIAFHDNAEAAGKPTLDLKANVADLVNALPGLDAALANNRISLSTFDTNIGTLFSDIQKLAKSDLPSAIHDISAAIQDLINNQHWDQANQGVQVYQGLIDKLAKENLPATVRAEQDLINKLIEMKAPLGDILDAEEKDLQFQITAAEKAGENADEEVMALEKVRLKKQELTLASHGYADQEVAMINDVLKGFDSLADAMAGAIIDGKNLGEALVGAFKKIGQSLLDDVLKAAMVPLKAAMMDLIGQMLPNLNLGFQVTGASAKALSDAMATQSSVIQGVVDADLAATAAKTANTGATAADTGATIADTGATVADTGATIADTGATIADTGATIASTAATLADAAAEIANTTAEIAETAATIAATVAQIAFTSVVSAVAGVVGAIAGIVGDVYLAAIDTKLFHVETSLLEIRNTIENTQADARSQFDQMFTRLGEIKNDADSTKDSLLQIAANGAAGGLPEGVITDLNDTGAMARRVYAGWPTMQGSLQTIAQDIVTWGGYIESDTAVMVSKLGAIVTLMMQGNALAEAAPSAADVAAAANDISAAVGDAADQASNDTETAASDLSAAVADGATQTSDAVASTTDEITSAVGDTTAAVNDVGTSVDGTTQAVIDSGQGIADAVTAGAEHTATVMIPYLASVGQTVIDSGNRAASETVDAINKQIAIAQSQFDAATSEAAQLTALRNEYADYERLIAKAIQDGDLHQADIYQTAAANLLAQIRQVQGDIQGVPSLINQEIVTDTGKLGFQVTGAGALVATAVNNAATTISTAVTAAVAAVGMRPTGPGTTASTTAPPPYVGPSPAAGSTPAPTGGGGFGGPTTKNPTNSPANIPPTVVSGTENQYDPNIPDPTKPKAPYVAPVDTTSPTSSYYKPPVAASSTPATSGVPSLNPQPVGTQGTPLPTGTTTPPAASAPTDPVAAAVDRLTVAQTAMAHLMQELSAASAAQKPLIQQQIDVEQKELAAAQMAVDLAKQQSALVAKLATDQVTQMQLLRDIGNAPDDATRTALQQQANDILKTIADDQAKLADIQQRMAATTTAAPVTGGPEPNPAAGTTAGTTAPVATGTPSAPVTSLPATPSSGGTLVYTDPSRPLAVTTSGSTPGITSTPSAPQTGGLEPTPTSGTTDPVADAMAKLQADQAKLADIMQRMANATDAQKPLLQAQIDNLHLLVEKDQEALVMAKQATAVAASKPPTTGSLPTPESLPLPPLKGGPVHGPTVDIPLASGGGEPESAAASGSGSSQAPTVDLSMPTTAVPPAMSPEEKELAAKALLLQKVIADDQQKLIDAQKTGDATRTKEAQEALDVANVQWKTLQEQVAALKNGASVPTLKPIGPAPAPVTGGPEPQPTPTPAAPVGTGSNLDPQLVGFWSGLLAEEEDIRDTLHSIRDLNSSMRDSYVTVGKELGDMLAVWQGIDLGNLKRAMDVGGSDLSGGVSAKASAALQQAAVQQTTQVNQTNTFTGVVDSHQLAQMIGEELQIILPRMGGGSNS